MAEQSIRTVRCKFRCTSVEKHEGWGGHAFLYKAKFSAVSSDDTEENKKFHAATPSGNVEFSSIVPNAFLPGRQYYFDIIPADENEVERWESGEAFQK